MERKYPSLRKVNVRSIHPGMAVLSVSSIFSLNGLSQLNYSVVVMCVITLV